MTADSSARKFTLADARAQFPGADRWVYANVASKGIISQRSEEHTSELQSH